MTESDLNGLIDQHDDFRSLNDLTVQIVELTTELSAPIQKISGLIASDEKLLSQMLSVINAPFNRFSDTIPNIEQAVNLIGYRKICGLAAAIALLRQFQFQDDGEYDVREHWEYGLHVAVTGAELASRMKGELQVEAFAIGLLQDMGTLLIARCLPISYGKALGLSEARDLHISQAEKELLKISHADAGAILCQRWKLHPTIVDAVRFHHFPETGDAKTESERPLVQLSSLSNTAADVLLSAHPDDARELLYDRAEQFFGLGPNVIDEILDKVPELVLKLAPPMDVVVRDPEAASEEVPHLSVCPNCGSEAAGSGKFCSECGQALLSEDAAKALSTEKILIAEDSAATRLALSILIRRLGFTPVEAYSGVEAVQLAEKERPGLLSSWTSTCPV